jgi:hypothetical protein
VTKTDPKHESPFLSAETKVPIVAVTQKNIVSAFIKQHKILPSLSAGARIDGR